MKTILGVLIVILIVGVAIGLIVFRGVASIDQAYATNYAKAEAKLSITRTAAAATVARQATQNVLLTGTAIRGAVYTMAASLDKSATPSGEATIPPPLRPSATMLFQATPTIRR